MLRSVLFLALMTATAAADPVAQLSSTDAQLVLDSTGDLQITRAKKVEHVKLPVALTRAQLQFETVGKVPTIIVSGDQEGFVVTNDGGWKVSARTPIGGGSMDDYSTALVATPTGVYRYQVRFGGNRCDGKPALLFAEQWTKGTFERVQQVPTMVAAGGPAVTAKIDPDKAAPQARLYKAVFASTAALAMDAAALPVPTELDDNDPKTSWHEDLPKSSGEGQFFKYKPTVDGKRAAQLRIVTSAVKGANHPKRLAIVNATGALHVDVPDGKPGDAFIADLPQPMEGCVSVVIESTWGASTGDLSIAELAVYADGERTGGADADLAQAIADDKDVNRAMQTLARGGANAVTAIKNALANKTNDHNARVRLFRAAMVIKDPSAAALLASGAKEHELQGADLVNAINALTGMGVGADLHDLALDKSLSLDARVAAVHALVAADPKDRDLLISLAGHGLREVRQATIENLTSLPVATLITAAQAQTHAPAAGDLWRAVTRRAHNNPADRPAALAAMTAAVDTTTDYERRYRLVDGIAALGDAAALKSLAATLAKIPAGAKVSAFRHVAARAIAVNPRPEAFDLLATLVTDSDAGVRLSALSALSAASGGSEGAWHGAVGADGIDRILQTSLLTDEWPEVRRFSAMVLGGRCSRPGPAAALADSLARDKNFGVRNDSLSALVECKAPGTAALLEKLWDDGKAPVELRRHAVDLTVGLGDATLGGKLVGKFGKWRGAALESEAALALAQNAAYAIGQLAPPGAAQALEAALDDSAFPEIVGAAAASLGLMRTACPATAKAKLEALATSSEPQVQAAAAHAAALCGK